MGVQRDEMSRSVRFGPPRALVIAIGTALVAACLFACARHAALPARPAGELRVGVAPGNPPVAYHVQGRLVGIEPELATRLGRGLGRDVRFVELPEDELIPALRAHRVDILMTGLQITPERSAEVLFARPYMRVGEQALIRREDAERFSDPAALTIAGARVGFVRGSGGGRYVGRELRSSEAYAFPSAEDAVRSLRARRIDFFIHDGPAVWRLGVSDQGSDLQTLQPSLTEAYLAWAVAPNDAALKAQVDEQLLAWLAGGELDALLSRWIPGRADSEGLAP
jgi:polar amino acid transport system substrate-binding protein